ncbi:MAG: S-methyl-5-thioribose-1-phosphate isomerase [Euryarchaeota archaeon]|nr:S-methyl-5-thioribose-1-phosphate isomerase [Euryarchaeota archaeon]
MKVRSGRRTRDIPALWYEPRKVVFIDQRLLPATFRLYEARSLRQLAFAIKEMVVRGAPAIGAAAAFGMALAQETGADLGKAAELIRGTRPTAYDLFYGVECMLKAASEGKDLREASRAYAEDIVGQCHRIGIHGARLIQSGNGVLTHCNAGALATIDWGTALAPIRVAHNAGKKLFVFVDETRPRLQGARLTSWELQNEGIPHAVIADNAAGHFMARHEVDLCIVGADRIAVSGDFANKIGTYEKAVLAKENGIPFYVAAPASTFDRRTRDGRGIPIEERSENEVHLVGRTRVTPRGAMAWNPAFDVTPARYVTAFMTEKGLLPPARIRDEL